jgi:hypothetical protein
MLDGINSAVVIHISEGIFETIGSPEAESHLIGHVSEV